MAVNANTKGRTLADPCAAYESVKSLWGKSRAICGGERYVKDYDAILDVINYTNLLIPFSPSMTPMQYAFYRAEAELPGIVSQYAKIIVGGLLRKQPVLELPKDAPAEAKQWIQDAFSQDSSPLVSFMDKALWEEVQARAWVYIDYPVVHENEVLTPEDYKALKPYPVLWEADTVINWQLGTPGRDGNQKLIQLITRYYKEDRTKNEFHPDYIDTVCVHEIVGGFYQIREYTRPIASEAVVTVNGRIAPDYTLGGSTSGSFVLKGTNTNIRANGERLTMIPAWPLNGSYTVSEPLLNSLVDREVSLYNKVSRRNHLLYGASTYTPVISSDMTDDAFEEVVKGGLGSWIHLAKGDVAGVLNTPTEALKDMDRAILSTIEEMARMGIRMLSPETSQSGVALDIRNAAQTAQLGTMNIKISNQMSDIIAFMLNWRYDKKYTSADVKFTLSADFNPAPLGADWLRLVTEWYETGKLPRSAWLESLKTNDMLSPDYDDEEGQAEITQDQLINIQRQSTDFAAQQTLQQELLASQGK